MQQPEDLDIIKMIVMKQKSFIFYLRSEYNVKLKWK